MAHGLGGRGARRTRASDPGALEFDDFLVDIGAMLMGRRTYDVVRRMEIARPYGELPVLVATHRSLDDAPPTVRAVSGDIHALIAQAKDVASGKDVYLDGGVMVRQALDAGLVDHMVLTFVPALIGRGHSLFAGLETRHRLEYLGWYRYRGNALQVHVRPLRDASCRPLARARTRVGPRGGCVQERARRRRWSPPARCLCGRHTVRRLRELAPPARARSHALEAREARARLVEIARVPRQRRGSRGSPWCS